MNNKNTLIKRIVFSDVDGTVYGFPNKILREETLNSVVEAKEKNNTELVLCTGNGAFNKIQTLANKLLCRYIVTANGAAIFDNQTKEYLHFEYMDKNEAKRVFGFAKKVNTTLYYFGKDQYYLYNANRKIRQFFTDFCEYVNWIEDGRINDDIYKIEIYDEQSKMDEITKLVKKEKFNFEVSYQGTHIEMTAKGVNKGSGLKWVCNNIFNADLNYVMAIGDSENDISMMKVAGFSYAMDNAKLAVKKVAKYYTSDVLQDGLGEAIRDYIFRTRFDIEKQDLALKLERQKAKNKY